jgi:hypothetical protein
MFGPLPVKDFASKALGFQAPAQPPNGIIVSLDDHPFWLEMNMNMTCCRSEASSNSGIQTYTHIHINIYIYTVPCLVLGHIYI